MGTRNLTMVILDGKTRVAQYGQYDGYPGGQGVIALKFLTKMMAEDKLEVFKNQVRKTEFADSKKTQELEEMDESILLRDYPQYDRNVAASVLGMIMVNKEEPMYISNHESFAADSLFCEWAYVVDLDNQKFEVYKGFNKEPLSKVERFYHLQKDNENYNPVRFVQFYDFKELPTPQEFCNYLNKDNNDE